MADTRTRLLADKAGNTVGVTAGGALRVVSGGSPQNADRIQVASATVDIALLAADTSRHGFTVWNDSTANLFVCLGTAPATAASATHRIQPGGYWEAPYGYGGAVRGIWDAADGAARITSVRA